MTDTIGRPPVRYAMLRSGGVWLSGIRLDGLEVEPSGDIVLGRVPAVTPASLNPAASIDPSGIAVGPECLLFVGDLSAGRVVRIRLDCGPVPPGTPDRAVDVAAASGMCIGPHGWLFVADVAGGQVLVFTEALELRDRWLLPGSRPVAVAFDGERVIVVDASAAGLLRFSVDGVRDEAFVARAVFPSECGTPRGLASDAEGNLYVGCASGVIRYTREGDRIGAVLAAGARAGALAVAGGALYVADEITGEIQLFSLPSGSSLGTVVGFGGPVAGLALDGDGDVYVKTGSDDAFVVARASGAHRRSGTLEVAGLDAGVATSWRRASLHALVPDGCDARLETYQSDDPSAAPVWVPAAAVSAPLHAGRFLSIRVALETRDPFVSPRLRQVQAETLGESYIEHLPAVYSRDPQTSGFLERFLDLAHSVLGDLENDVEELPRLVQPVTAPAEHLAWLASWQGFDVPARLAGARDAETLRAILARLFSLNARRGTLAGLRELISIETGVRAHVIECFRARSVWVLGSASSLGFDTGLPRVSLDSAVVDQSALDGAALGPEEGLGRALFDDTAHRFSVLVPTAEAPREVEKRAVRRAVDDLKPAHADAHVCFIGPSLRVGLQARVGVDSIVAGEPAPTTLNEGDALGRGARLANDPVTASGAVERRARVGIDTRLG